jgi:hypothetical protein
MIGIQILAILFALWMIYFTTLHFRRREYSLSEYLFWMVLWVGLVVVVIFPTSVRFIVSTLRISRTFDFVVIVAIMALFGATFRNTILLRRTKGKLEEFIRKEALDDAEKREQ